MKNLKISSIFLSLFISYAIMINGCAVYNRPVSAESAINKGPVKVVTTDHLSFKYNSLTSDNGRILGVKRTANSVRYQQIPGNISYVQLKDREASALLTTVAVVSGIGIIVIPIVALNSLAESMSGFSMNNGGGWCIDPGDNHPVFGK